MRTTRLVNPPSPRHRTHSLIGNNLPDMSKYNFLCAKRGTSTNRGSCRPALHPPPHASPPSPFTNEDHHRPNLDLSAGLPVQSRLSCKGQRRLINGHLACALCGSSDPGGFAFVPERGWPSVFVVSLKEGGQAFHIPGMPQTAVLFLDRSFPPPELHAQSRDFLITTSDKCENRGGEGAPGPR